MTVDIHCPTCGEPYSVADENVGTRMLCQRCGHSFTLSMAFDDTTKPVVDAPPPAEMPKKLGPYVIRRLLGTGMMGHVYLAYDPNLDREVALKVLPPTLAADETRRKRFLREAKLAARVQHTNVAQIHQAGIDGPFAYIAMEFVQGNSLAQVIAADGPLPWREATRVIRDAAAGLRAAHELGLVHRDIKPANLVRTSDGITKVLDFGLARADQTETQLTQPGMLLGTPAYMAPEQWIGSEADARSDLYALTCTWYCLLVGHGPFHATSLPAMGYQHRHEPLPDPRDSVPDLPDHVCRLLLRGAAKNPSARFQSPDELIAEVDALLAAPERSLASGSAWDQLARLPATELIPPPESPDRQSSNLATVPVSPPGARSARAEARSVRVSDPAETADRRSHGNQEHGCGSVGRPATAREWPAGAERRPSVWLAFGARKPRRATARWRWIAVGGAAALLLALAVVLTFSTKYGMVRITLANADDSVHVTVDGETIDIHGLDEPLRVEVGPHEFVARSPKYETVTRSFRVQSNKTTLVDVRFEPVSRMDSGDGQLASPGSQQTDEQSAASKPAAPATARNEPPLPVPVLHFEFEGDARNSGSLGSSHDGSLHGDGFFSPDAARGSQAYATGSGGYIVLPATRLGDRITLAAWVKLDDGVKNIQAILSSWTSRTGGFSWGLNSWTRDDRIVLLETWSPAGATSGTRSGPGAVNYGQWHHVAVTLDRTSGAVTVYVDGAAVNLAGSGFAADFTDNLPLSIGRYHGVLMAAMSGRPILVEAPFHFTGLLDDLRVYDTVLTAAEIKTMREEPKPK
jgi:serine/threonine protein kinase